MALGDYFTEAEFRELSGKRQPKDQTAYSTEDIERAHDEVVDRFEAWARASWKLRTATMQRYLTVPIITLRRVPVVEISTFTLDGYELTAGDYELDLVQGGLAWGGLADRYDLPVLLVVEWTYGYDLDVADIPWWIKTPMIRAAASRLDPQEGRTKVPKNVSEYRTGATTFQMRLERSQTRPWPWDESMSAEVRAQWDSYRPRSYVS